MDHATALSPQPPDSEQWRDALRSALFQGSIEALREQLSTLPLGPWASVELGKGLTIAGERNWVAGLEALDAAGASPAQDAEALRLLGSCAQGGLASFKWALARHPGALRALAPDSAEAGGILYSLIQRAKTGGARAALGAGVSPQALNAEGQGALHAAMAHDSQHLPSQLLALGAPLNPVDHQGRSPAHFAAARGRLWALRALLRLGASLDEPDAQGHTPLALCVARGDLEGCRLLALHGAKLTDAKGQSLALLTPGQALVPQALLGKFSAASSYVARATPALARIKEFLREEQVWRERRAIRQGMPPGIKRARPTL